MKTSLITKLRLTNGRTDERTNKNFSSSRDHPLRGDLNTQLLNFPDPRSSLFRNPEQIGLTVYLHVIYNFFLFGHHLEFTFDNRFVKFAKNEEFLNSFLTCVWGEYEAPIMSVKVVCIRSIA